MNQPVITVCSDKSIQVCNFRSIFQTLLKSDFIVAVNTPEIHFSPKNFLQNLGSVYTQMRVIHPVYSNISVTCISIQPYKSKTYKNYLWI